MFFTGVILRQSTTNKNHFQCMHNMKKNTVMLDQIRQECFITQYYGYRPQFSNNYCVCRVSRYKVVLYKSCFLCSILRYPGILCFCVRSTLQWLYYYRNKYLASLRSTLKRLFDQYIYHCTSSKFAISIGNQPECPFHAENTASS